MKTPGAKIKQIEEELSQMVWSNNDVDFAKLSGLVVQRNLAFYHGFVSRFSKSPEKPYENVCELLLTESKIPSEFRAYRAGSTRQEVLESKGIEFEGHLTHNHIYFSLNLEEVIRDYFLPEGYQNRVVYITDLRNLKNARVQTSYSGETLWNDKLRTLIECYNDFKFMDELVQERCDNARFAKPFKNKSREELKDAIIKEIETWLPRFTIPFKLKHLNRYKNKRQDFILVPSPVRVLYKD